MKVAVLTREPSTDQGTLGTFTIEGVAFHSLELPWRGNRRQRSCIPAGEYVCRIVRSPRFGRVFNVTNVSGRSAILIHSGNFGGDIEKGWQSHIEGCILLGLRRGKLQNLNGSPQSAVLLSKPAIRQFMELAGPDPFLLRIEEKA